MRLHFALILWLTAACSTATEDPPAPGSDSVETGAADTSEPADTPAVDVEPGGDEGQAPDETGVEPPVDTAEADATSPPTDRDCVSECPYDGAAACDGAARLVCTTDASTGCLVWAAPSPCDDGDACTTDSCSGQGECGADPIPGCQEGCEACPDTCVGGKCPICEPGENGCDGAELTQCSADGTQTLTLTTCEAGCEQSADGAVSCKQCEAGAITCLDPQTPATCGDPEAGWTAVAKTCGTSYETCLGGVCKGLLAWSLGDTLEDTLLFFTIHAAACAAVGPLVSVDPHLCWVLDTTNLKQTLTAAAIAASFCDDPELTADDFLPVDGVDEATLFETAGALYACGGGEPGKLVLTATEGQLLGGKAAGFYCMIYDHLSQEVRIVECPE